MLAIISRDEAHAAGKPRYFTGVPCKNGHLAERYVTQGQCIDCLRKFKKFVANAYTSELVPWSPAMVYVPRIMDADQYAGLQDFLEQCAEHWVTQKGLATPAIAQAYVARREFFARRKQALEEQAAINARDAG